MERLYSLTRLVASIKVANVISDEIISKLDFSSRDNFISSIKVLSEDELKTVYEFNNNKKEQKRGGHIKLYHGTTDEKYSKIKDNGFEITKGMRARDVLGFGENYEVDNQGIFLADTYNLARFFGENRSNHGRGSVIESYIPESLKLLDTTVKVPDAIMKEVRKFTKARYIASADWIALFDKKEFVDSIKGLGYHGATFKEEIGNRRDSGNVKSLTYVIFSPSDIKLEKSLVYSVDDIMNDLKSMVKK